MPSNSRYVAVVCQFPDDAARRHGVMFAGAHKQWNPPHFPPDYPPATPAAPFFTILGMTAVTRKPPPRISFMFLELLLRQHTVSCCT